ncbi:hypothetical protein LAZ67_13002304 [Cordylochernes scorpioides]|uniref:Uncharacterized protein n=1 Tax=Cordylochernes scorpioides TaxID=51811 RepID=A0ABY6L4Y1_9ARAC|nr:hypothetical protein LAZ67_13002304 [Cordylochernes scorpioides]
MSYPHIEIKQKVQKNLQDMQQLWCGINTYPHLLIPSNGRSLAENLHGHRTSALHIQYSGHFDCCDRERCMGTSEALHWTRQQQQTEGLCKVERISDSGVVNMMYADDSKTKNVLQDLENIDDETDKLGIPFVKINDYKLASELGLADELPSLVYYENSTANIFQGGTRKLPSLHYVEVIRTMCRLCYIFFNGLTFY